VVSFYCLRSAAGVSTLEIEWIRSLARCERALDVAIRHGYSERDFYSALDRLWDRLGVGGRSQALVLAARMGWLDNLEGDIQLS
jgi:DNA-binding CsgD family transcriptional regulator